MARVIFKDNSFKIVTAEVLQDMLKSKRRKEIFTYEYLSENTKNKRSRMR